MSSHFGDDASPRSSFGMVCALLALALCAVAATVIYQCMRLEPDTASGSGTSATEPASDAAEVHVKNGVVHFHFAPGKADIAIGGNVALADVVRGVAYGKRARISGFHDAVGDVAANKALAKRRALAVYATLLSLGVDADRIELQKPEDTRASGSPEQARRVEVTLID